MLLKPNSSVVFLSIRQEEKPPELYLEQAIDQIGQIAESCHRSDLTFGLEVEANLVGPKWRFAR